MYFYAVSDLDLLIMKAMFPSKQRKLSHMIAVNGHQYLMKDMLKQIDLYTHHCSGLAASQIHNQSLSTAQTKREQRGRSQQLL